MIELKCQEISARILIKIDKKKPTEIKIFEEDQDHHRKEMQLRLKVAFEDIKQILCETYESFL